MNTHQELSDDRLPALRTAVVEGPLAFQMRRFAAAQINDCGLQILNLPQVAARLAGCFTSAASAEQLEPAIKDALDEGGFVELEQVRHLPGMTRAVLRTMRKIWAADVDLSAAGRDGQRRIAEMSLIEGRLKSRLPLAAMMPRDLRDAALKQVRHAPRLIGEVRIEGSSFIAPVWRPLIEALREIVPVEWIAPAEADVGWFRGKIVRADPAAKPPAVVSCADVRHEVVESLRWARQLIASGIAKPNEIAIASANTTAWDDHFLACAEGTGFRLHFSHGISALATRDGQRCAALADLLMHGLSQQRVRRLFAVSRGQGLPPDELPSRWLDVIPRGAALSHTTDWRRALETADRQAPGRVSVDATSRLLEVLARGPAAADEAAAAFLRGRSLQIWQAATRSAPTEAIELSLRGVRLAAETDAADAVAWCPASDLAAAPRPHVRLLGLTNRGWPRGSGEDPILPDHVLAADAFDVDPVARADRRHFAVILGAATGSVTLSRSRRGAQGGRVGRSPLLQSRRMETVLTRERIPEHAFNQSDRLLARAEEAAGIDQVGSAGRCWRDWHVERLTDHDGCFEPAHPAIKRSIERIQSATSLQRLLRDPLGFVWKYALGFDVPQQREQPLTIAPDEFGKLVHELLRRAVDALEPEPGYAKASDIQIENALEAASRVVHAAWPVERPVPPRLLWAHTVEYAKAMALAGLLRKEINQDGTRSWTEVPFGQPAGFEAGRELPWDPTIPVEIPGTPVRLRGTIDRLDMRNDPFAVRVTDYKTGTPPKNAARIVIGGGAELQRALYTLACRQLFEEEPQVRARLLYLAGEPFEVRLQDPDAALARIGEFVTEVVAILQRGNAVPGRLAYDRSNDLRLAFPASPGYERRKRVAFDRAAGGLSKFWSAA